MQGYGGMNGGFGGNAGPMMVGSPGMGGVPIMGMGSPMGGIGMATSPRGMGMMQSPGVMGARMLPSPPSAASMMNGSNMGMNNMGMNMNMNMMNNNNSNNRMSGPGMSGPGMSGPGMNNGPGMMGPGMDSNNGMMGPGMNSNNGMMGPGMMGPGMNNGPSSFMGGQQMPSGPGGQMQQGGPGGQMQQGGPGGQMQGGPGGQMQQGGPGGQMQQGGGNKQGPGSGGIMKKLFGLSTPEKSPVPNMSSSTQGPGSGGPGNMNSNNMPYSPSINQSVNQPTSQSADMGSSMQGPGSDGQWNTNSLAGPGSSGVAGDGVSSIANGPGSGGIGARNLGAPPGVDSMMKGVSSTMNGPGNNVSSVMNGPGNNVSSTMNGPGNNVSSVMNGPGNNVSSVMNGPGNNVSSTMNGPGNNVSSTMNGPGNNVSSVMNGPGNNVSSVMNGPGNNVSSTMNGPDSGPGLNSMAPGKGIASSTKAMLDTLSGAGEVPSKGQLDADQLQEKLAFMKSQAEKQQLDVDELQERLSKMQNGEGDNMYNTVDMENTGPGEGRSGAGGKGDYGGGVVPAAGTLSMSRVSTNNNNNIVRSAGGMVPDRNTPEGKNLPPMPSPGERMNRSVNFEQSVSDGIEDQGPGNQVVIGPDGMPMLMHIPEPEPEPVLLPQAPVMDQMKVAKEAKVYHQDRDEEALAGKGKGKDKERPSAPPLIFADRHNEPKLFVPEPEQEKVVKARKGEDEDGNCLNAAYVPKAVPPRTEPMTVFERLASGEKKGPASVSGLTALFKANEDIIKDDYPKPELLAPGLGTSPAKGLSDGPYRLGLSPPGKPANNGEYPASPPGNYSQEAKYAPPGRRESLEESSFYDRAPRSGERGLPRSVANAPVSGGPASSSQRQQPSSFGSAAVGESGRRDADMLSKIKTPQKAPGPPDTVSSAYAESKAIHDTYGSPSYVDDFSPLRNPSSMTAASPARNAGYGAPSANFSPSQKAAPPGGGYPDSGGFGNTLGGGREPRSTGTVRSPPMSSDDILSGRYVPASMGQSAFEEGDEYGEAEFVTRISYDASKEVWNSVPCEVRPCLSTLGHGTTSTSRKIKDMGTNEVWVVRELNSAGLAVQSSKGIGPARERCKVASIASTMAQKFNECGPPAPVRFLPTRVYCFKNRNGAPSFYAEPFVSGGYNKGMATEKAHNDMEYAAIAAFEHFTFAFSDGGFVIANPMMIDDGRWCQPELHSSADPSLGGEDNRGMPGVDEFLKEHRCERLCNLMDLPALPAPSGRPSSKGGRRRGSDVSEPRTFNVFPPIEQD